MIHDWRYVSSGEYAAFRRADSTDLRERVYQAALTNAEQQARTEKRRFDAGAFRSQFLKDIPLGAIEMGDAFSMEGEYGRWLRTHHAVVVINGIVYVHGGISPAHASLGCRGINTAVASDLAIPSPTPAQGQAMFSSQENGPLWYRGLISEPDTFAPEVGTILTALNARAIVVGHSVSRNFKIATRFGGRVFQIDTGMLGGEVYTGGQPSALEISGDRFTAIYAASRETLPAPPQAGAAAALAR
jgi:hypothetical protein